MDKNDKLFSQLLYRLHQNAFSELESVDQNNATETDAQKVRQLIDMIEMLKDKTKGNLANEVEEIQSMMLEELESLYKKKFVKFMSNESAGKQQIN